ncbi:AMP-binding protein [Magnetofaba australis]|uniref:Putative acyl-CoA synthetase, AMP-forming n=1 Tax=Magnetofaba australis IT-1 TaxID=1434232 RepID=A0A1Y2K7K1_9PROT|nr:AMP-binding protein [Magnetofaba australis]OSM06155.1 putative acyl-CoA synthetase, AMP-forming [Magnetofaba australis IT-1]
MLPDLLRRTAETRPDHLAIADGARRLSWRQLHILVMRMAAGLRELGVTRGQRVGVWLDKGIEQAAGFYAPQLLGGVTVMLNEGLKIAQAEHIVADCAIEVLITDAKRLQQHGAALKARGAERVLLCDVDALPDDAALSGLCLSATDAAEERRAPGIPADTAHIIYTSGSTGLPKGIVISHQNALDGARIVSGYTQLGDDERILGLLPLNFDYGLNQWLNAAHTGSAYFVHRFALPNELLKQIEQERLTVVAGMPPVWSRLLDPKLVKAEHGRDLTSVRAVTNSGGRVPVPMVEKLRALFAPPTRIYLMYGLTEAFRSTYLPPEELARHPDSMGRAIPEVEIQVVRPDGSACDVGEEGELVHRGALISKGYWNNPAKSAEVFRPAPGLDAANAHLEQAVYSGDLVHRDAEGLLYFHGRRDQMIKTKGYRVSPEEVERLLLEIDGVTGAVAGAFDMGADYGVRAVVTLSDAALTPPILRRQCQQRAPFYLVPDEIVALTRFPLTANGKIDRAAALAQAAPENSIG